MRRHPEDVNPASLDLHNKEHVEAPQQHRVDVEEVARQQATRLGTQEHLPAHARQPRSRAQASTSQDTPHGALPHPVTQLREFALDPPVPPTGVLLGQPDRQLADLLRYRRPARAVRKAPVTGDQPAMPIEQRAGVTSRNPLNSCGSTRRRRRTPPDPTRTISGEEPDSEGQRPHGAAPGSLPPSGPPTGPTARANRTADS